MVAPIVTSLSQCASRYIRAYIVAAARPYVAVPTSRARAGAMRATSPVTAAAKAKAAVACPEGKDS